MATIIALCVVVDVLSRCSIELSMLDRRGLALEMRERRGERGAGRGG